MEVTSQTRRACFGAFEVDLLSGELYKRGIRLKLQDQPFRVLALLLEHPGEVVSREELRQRLWPADTFVDFDTGLNSAIKKLREVLADSAEKPRYIETLPRRGYRFIASLAPGHAAGNGSPAVRSQPTMGRAIVILHPSAIPEANELLQRAMVLIRMQYEPLQARSIIERALQLDPQFTEARAYYGVTYVIAVEGGMSNDSGDIFRAGEELRRVIAEDPQIALAHAMMGAVHFFHGQTDLAREEFLQAIQIAPGDLGGEVWLVIQERFLGKEGAASAAARLVESEPLFWPARYIMGELLREQGKTTEALHTYEAVLQQNPMNSTVLCCLARTHLDAGDLVSARGILERLRPLDVPNFRVRILRAQLHALEGDRGQALMEMDEDVLKYADLQPFAALDAAEVYSILGETEKAIDWLNRSMRKGDGRTHWLRIDPLLATVRQHSRFQQILNSMEFHRQQRNASPAKQF